MSREDEYLARILKSGSRALASYAAGELLETHPEASGAPDAFAAWQGWLAVRVEELAAAVTAGHPTLFISQVQWAKAVLAARGIAAEHFRAGLESLRSVLAQELPEPVRPLADEYVGRALDAFDREPADLSARLLPDTPGGRLASSYLLALLEGDRRRARQLILDAVDRGLSVRDIYLQVLMAAQRELGRMWLAGEINVAEEHFTSATTRIVMAQLLARATFRAPNGKTMLAAAVAGNQHDIGLQAVADFFEMAGWRTIHLGANVPITDLVQAVDCFEVDLVALSASQSTQLPTLKDAIEAVRQGERGVGLKIMVGGLAFAGSEELAHEMGADGFASDPNEAVRRGNRLVGLPE